MPIILALERKMEAGEHKFMASLVYMKVYHKKKKQVRNKLTLLILFLLSHAKEAQAYTNFMVGLSPGRKHSNSVLW